MFLDFGRFLEDRSRKMKKCRLFLGGANRQGSEAGSWDQGVYLFSGALVFGAPLLTRESPSVGGVLGRQLKGFIPTSLRLGPFCYITDVDSISHSPVRRRTPELGALIRWNTSDGELPTRRQRGSARNRPLVVTGGAFLGEIRKMLIQAWPKPDSLIGAFDLRLSSAKPTFIPFWVSCFGP